MVLNLFLGCLQLFSGMSHLLMGAWSLSFNPLRVTLLNFLIERGRNHITSDWRVCTYLSTRFEPRNAITTRRERDVCTKRKLASKTRQTVLQALHKIISFSLRKVKRSALKYFSCDLIDNHFVLLHSVLCFYIVDTFDCKDLLPA